MSETESTATLVTKRLKAALDTRRRGAALTRLVEAAGLDDAQAAAVDQISEGWLYRFADAVLASRGRNRDGLWAGALRQELAQPGSVPPATLTLAADLADDELGLCAHLRRFAVGDIVKPVTKGFLDEHGLSFEPLCWLTDCGVMRGAGCYTKTLSSREEGRFMIYLIYGDQVLVVTHDDPDRKLTLSCLLLTRAGTALMRLLPFRPHPEYILRVIDGIAQQGFTVQKTRLIADRGHGNLVVTSPFQTVAVEPFLRRRLIDD